MSEVRWPQEGQYIDGVYLIGRLYRPCGHAPQGIARMVSDEANFELVLFVYRHAGRVTVAARTLLAEP